nr:hypothetical protein [Herbaspirillum sp. ASV7]
MGNLNDYHLTLAPKLYTYLGPTTDWPLPPSLPLRSKAATSAPSGLP